MNISEVVKVDTVKISAYLKNMRLQNGLTQQNVADLVGLTPQAISKWERCESLPDISLLPELAKIFKINIEDILTAGEPKEIDFDNITKTLNYFVDDRVFQKIVNLFKNTADARKINVPAELFIILNNEQKNILLDYLVNMDNCGIMIDSILQYLNIAQRDKLIKCLTENGDYDILETLMPFASRAVRTEIVRNLLERRDFDFLEEIILYLNREQKNMIFQYFIINELDYHILENFLPFFDRNQRKSIIRKED